MLHLGWCLIRSKLGIPPFLLTWAIGGTMAIAQYSAPIATVPTSGAALARSHQWTSLGPDGGSISAVVIDSQNPRTVYAATQGNGVFKSADGGASWSSASDGLPGPFVINLVMNPQNTNTLYALMNGFGVYKTTDGGTNWNPARSGLPCCFGVDLLELPTLVIDPQHPDTLYTAPSYSGVYKTTDGGASWVAVNSGLPGNSDTTSLAIDPQNPNTLYALSGLGTHYETVFKTTDGGASWRAVGSAPPGYDWATAILLVDPQNPSTLYAGTFNGVLKSKDAGVTWANSGLSGAPRILGLAFESQGPSTIYALAITRRIMLPSGKCCSLVGSLFKSMDGGANWVGIGDGLTGPDFDPQDDCSCGYTHLGLAIDPANPDTLYVGTYGAGIFKSADNGASWNAANAGLKAIPDSAFSGSLAVDPQNPRTLYLASRNRVYQSTDAGTNWNSTAWGVPDVDLTTLAIDPQKPRTIYAGSAHGEDFPTGGIFKSVDGGISWLALNTPDWGGLRSLTIDPYNSRTLYAGAEWWGVYKSRDGGETWAAGTPPVRGIGPIAVDPKHPETIYAGVGNPPAPVIKSVDSAASWNPASTGLPDGGVSALAIDPQNPDTVYAGLSGGSGREGVYKSVDGGATWNSFSSGLRLSRWVTALAIDPRYPSVLYVATDRGVFDTADGGASWTELDGGPRFGSISALTIDPQDSNKVYAAGNGGLFRIDISPE
jgi:photosystem II stability/assembly factor-like uncharacterized protein